MSDRLVILLHGVGSCGADIAGLGETWQSLMPGTAFVAPDAPFAFDRAPRGRQWFSIDGITDADRPDRVRGARPAFDRTIGRIVVDAGFRHRLDCVALVGFSQGAIMALDAVASGRWPVGAVVAFSGRLASPDPRPTDTGGPILLVHGGADITMPIVLAREADTALAALGFDVALSELPGAGHAVSAEGAHLAGRFLAGRLARLSGERVGVAP